jgi:hypothetical protein
MVVKRTWILDVRICWMVLAAFCCLSLIPIDASASLVESRLSDGSTLSSRAQMIETIRHALEKDIVAQRLADYGLGEGGILEFVIGVLLVVLLVVVILKLTNKTVVVK